MKALLKNSLSAAVTALFIFTSAGLNAQSNAALRLGEKSVFKDEAFRVHRQTMTKKTAVVVYGFKGGRKLPWCEYVQHDPDRPLPPIVQIEGEPSFMQAPSDAKVLFDGTSLDAWQPSKWKIDNGHMICLQGKIVSKESFGDAQIHVEWLVPDDYEGRWQNHGNSGVTLMDRYEIQIFDSWDYRMPLFADGQCGAIYGQTPPMVNVCREPGKWQSYDIFFTAPVFEGDKLAKPAYVTVFHNNILIHLNQQIYGETGHGKEPKYYTKTSTGPISLPSHECPVQFRNIWVRPLNK